MIRKYRNSTRYRTSAKRGYNASFKRRVRKAIKKENPT